MSFVICLNGELEKNSNYAIKYFQFQKTGSDVAISNTEKCHADITWKQKRIQYETISLFQPVWSYLFFVYFGGQNGSGKVGKTYFLGPKNTKLRFICN